ncbi:hypothetical protein F4604DRAFT_2026302 [Suillus subluteus]|nr:hypothetical protein F4604DRAFT_2026302 [Suillus subluteus]
MPGVTAPVQTAIRAVAFLLEEAAEVETADKVAKLVITAISSHIAKIQDASESITEATTQLNSTQEKISNTSVNIVKEASQQGGYKVALLKGLDNDNPDSPTTRRAARNAIKKCQVLIDIPIHSHLAPGKVSHEQLVKKIQEALKTINKDDSPNLDIRSVSQFRNGGTIIEMQTQEAMEYLKNKDNKNEFINTLDPNATIKERSYPVVIQFVPLTFNPDSAEHLRDLEQENEWEQDSITSAHWIKPPAKRTTTQRVAHLIITLKDLKAANEGIRDGITLNKNRLQMKKNK